ncbi:hypothetical protein JCM10908_003515 [Rhodotorula pacifica]|uniref:Mtc5p n=1 Tax=Rhodotorula pacifica TaxID=1495444 RepID=UPI00316FA426
MSLEHAEDVTPTAHAAREDPLAVAGRSGTASPHSEQPGTPDEEPDDADDALYDSEDTFYQLMSIHIDQPIGSMSISPANRDVALGSRTGLYIVDLQNPYDPPRFLPHASAWEVADVQWNPFPSRSEWVCSTSNQQAVVYNLSLSPALSASAVEHALYGHRRAVTDINWSPGSPEVLATSGMDGWVMQWDLRTGYGSTGRGRKPIWRASTWDSPATQVKFNRHEKHVIASAHGNIVHIWDDRMGATPVETVAGHSARIYGIDWCRKDPKQLVTCSLDSSFKSWRIDSLSEPLRSISTSSPIWRARWLPFGDGILTLPQRSDHALSIWSVKSIDDAIRQGDQPQSCARFEGAREGVKEFVWRTRGGEDPETDDRQFQLVTWAKDRRLRLWPISDALLKDVDHVKGSRIEVPMTRRGGPDISYRSFGEAPAPVGLALDGSATAKATSPVLQSGSLLSNALVSPPAPSLLTSSILNANLPNTSALREHFVPHPITSASRAESATMTTTKVKTRRQKEHDRLAWMEGVKVLRVPEEIDEPEGETVEHSDPSESVVAPSQPQTRASSVVQGTDAGTITAREGEDTERAESIMSRESLQTGTAVGKNNEYATLGEEVTSVVRRFPRVNFEKVHVAGRSCTVSLYSPLFIRATFTFPRTYPASSSPTIELERSIDLTLKQRAGILQGVRRLMLLRAERGLPSFEQALRFLSGDRSVEHIEEEEEEDDDAEEGLEGLGATSLGADLLRNNINVPPPRRGGACFGPRGQLLVFFPTDVTLERDNDDLTDSPSEEAADGGRRSFPLRLSDAFGSIAESADYAGDYQETDEALQLSTLGGMRRVSLLDPSVLRCTRQTSRTDSKRLQAHSRDQRRRRRPTTPAAATAFSTTIKIKDVSHLTLVHPDRNRSSLTKPLLDIARESALGAIESKDLLLAKIWTTILACFESGLGELKTATAAPLEALTAENILQGALKFLANLRDVQTLGIVACMLELCTRDVEESVRVHQAARASEDYFSQRHRPIDPINVVEGGSGERTPLPTSASLVRRRSDPSRSPRPSWANLTGLFNSSMLSLRSTSPASPPPVNSARLLPRAPPPSGHNSPTTPSPRPPKSPLRTSTIAGGTPTDHSHTHHRPGVTFGGTSVAVLPPKLSTDGEPSTKSPASRKHVQIAFAGTSYFPTCWWLSPRAQIDLELIRLAYAELLYRWGLNIERAQVLKLCRSATGNERSRQGLAAAILKEANGLGADTGIEAPRCCVGCGTVLQQGLRSCGKCHRRLHSVRCILCHQPVQGLTQSCSSCRHVGHLDCLATWFSGNDSCPTGCGCSCVSDGGTSGLFSLPSSRFGQSIAPPAASVPTVRNRPSRVITPSWAASGTRHL